MDYALNNKRRVIRLVLQWAAMYGDLLQEDDVAMAFLEVHGGHPLQDTPLSYNTGVHSRFYRDAVIANSRLCYPVHHQRCTFIKEKHHPLSCHSNSLSGGIAMYSCLLSFFACLKDV